MRKQKKNGKGQKESDQKAGLDGCFQIIVVIPVCIYCCFLFGQSRTNIGQAMNSTLSGGDVVLLNRAVLSLFRTIQGGCNLV